MKFHELPVGARFEFEGIEYVKTNPVIATSATGTTRLIRRSALLKPLDGIPPPAAASAAPPLDRATTLQAFEAFYQACIDVAGRHPDLESARRRFLDALK